MRAPKIIKNHEEFILVVHTYKKISKKEKGERLRLQKKFWDREQ